ncbi:MAG TPA: beta-L-arabinofuranosidase domain-containing protein [Terriglobales bacterium]|nr:beta-L-arabinofuranosidase domain-containing protein [Terriglobales bacterium]
MKNSRAPENRATVVASKTVAKARLLDRRQFLELAGLNSLALLLSPNSAHSTTRSAGATSPTPPPYAAFRSLAPGDVRPEGWLYLYLQKQAEQLGRKLPDVSWPFTGKYWSGEETPPETNGWWPWEQKGYWIDGALRCALALRHEQLLVRAVESIDYTLNHVLPDGYLGPSFARDVRSPRPAIDNFRWPHTVFFRALAAYGEATNDPRVATAMRRHYLADEHRTPYGGPSRDITNVEGMLWAYEHTGDEQLLALAERAWRGFTTSASPGDRESGDLHPDRVFSNAPIRAHGVTYIEKAKLPALLYMYTGREEYLRFALAAQERIFTHHMLIDGIPSTTEDYGQTTPLDAHETCDIADHTWTWGYLLMATGDGRWADHIERACFNAGLGAIRKDWRSLQYFSCPNQVIATQESCHVPFQGPGKGWMAYRPNPGHEVACCGGNAHRFLPNYVIRMWMSTPDGGLAAALYGASTVHAKVSRGGQHIEIHEETNYPFDENIHFTIRSARAVSLPLWLRIPAWCRAPRLSLNDQSLTLPPLDAGFIRLQRLFEPGDRITLTLPMQAALTYWSSDGLGVEHGPLVYALAVGEDWTPIVTPKWSNAEFPEWDVRPTTAWNYALALDEAQLAVQAQFTRKAITGDPWINSPVTLTVPMQKVPGWELQADCVHPDRKQTPPLPTPDQQLFTALTKSDIEQVALVPYGTTHLRLTIFPKAYPA